MSFLAAMVLSAAFVSPERDPLLPCPAGDEILWSDAGRCIGETRTVVGRVDRVVQPKNGNVYFNFCRDHRGCPFELVVFADRSAHFVDAGVFIGREVRATGKISSYRGRAQMVLSERSQLQLKPLIVRRPLAEEPEPEPKPVVAKAPPSMRTVSPARAGAHVGERVRVTGRVAAVERRGGDLHLLFRGEGEFRIVVLEPFVPQLESRVNSWVDARIVIEGEVALFDGKPAFFLSDAAEVLVLPKKP